MVSTAWDVTGGPSWLSAVRQQPDEDGFQRNVIS
jgi:hypothetical protein